MIVLNIVVAGASGYIGRALVPRLLAAFPEAKITAFSRVQQKSEDPRVVWRACDLFSLKSIEEALPEKVDLAYYLVHSMGPTAHLDQGSFADYDLILADNFARALKGVQHLIYLGGLLPERGELSRHLQSRLEVEETFAQYRQPTTVFRAGLILGDGGTSFQILLKLVQRLPIMLCPKWTQTRTTPVDLNSVIEALTTCAMKPSHFSKVYDLAGCVPLTYVEMMRQTAKRLGRRRFFISVPFFTPTLSRLWVSLITNSPKDLVYPLVESLEHEMVARPNFLYGRLEVNRSYSDLLEQVSVKIHPRGSVFRFRAGPKTVRSVQRLPLPSGCDASWLRQEYLKWLPQFLAPLIKVKVVSDLVSFSILRQSWVILELRLSEDRSDRDRQLLYIQKGWLVAAMNRGRLEFRVVLDRQFALAAIHDYQPSLPWYLYKFTQAHLHLVVMKAFARHLRKYPTSN